MTPLESSRVDATAISAARKLKRWFKGHPRASAQFCKRFITIVRDRCAARGLPVSEVLKVNVRDGATAEYYFYLPLNVPAGELDSMTEVIEPADAAALVGEELAPYLDNSPLSFHLFNSLWMTFPVGENIHANRGASQRVLAGLLDSDEREAVTEQHWMRDATRAVSVSNGFFAVVADEKKGYDERGAVVLRLSFHGFVFTRGAMTPERFRQDWRGGIGKKTRRKPKRRKRARLKVYPEFVPGRARAAPAVESYQWRGDQVFKGSGFKWKRVPRTKANVQHANESTAEQGRRIAAAAARR